MSPLMKINRRARLFVAVIAIVSLSVCAWSLSLRHVNAAAPASTPAALTGLVVTNTNDSGPGSLRQAITTANSTVGGETINVTATGTINLLSALPAFAERSVTITGPGSGSLRVRRRSAPGFADIPSFSILTVNEGVTVTITGLTISHGWSTAGAGIHNSGTLTLNSCVVSDSLANGSGGGILNDATGTLTLNNSTISNNEAWINLSGTKGGGLFNQGQASINGSAFSVNKAGVGGGGIYNDAGATATVTNTTLDGNSAHPATNGGGGGGILNAGTLSVSSSTISNNSAGGRNGGGIQTTSTSGAVAITDTTIRNNSAVTGGGIAINQSSPATGEIRFERVTISANTATIGGGLNNAGSVTLINCTISSNTGSNGAGVRTQIGSLTTINHSTVTRNTATFGGGGIDCNNAPVTSRASIISGNTANSFAPDIYGTINSQDFNLFGATSGDLQLHDIVSSDPQLTPLGDYGGSVQTHALLPSSLAVDHGPTTNVPPTDARDLPRPMDGNSDGNSVADIGAFEMQTYVVTNTNNSGMGSLRQALIDNNATGGALIVFNISGDGLHTIAPTSDTLLEITKPVHIDGYTQPGAVRNNASNGNNASLLIELSGAVAGFGATGINVTAGYSMIEGLVINRFNGDSGIWLNGTGATHNNISGNRLGTSADGSVRLGNFYGVMVFSASANIIGTDSDGTNDVAEGNLLSGNTGAGIGIFDSNSTQNTVAGNYTGTDRTGSTALTNGSGVYLSSDAHDNLIGGTSTFARNVISGNTQNGVVFEGGSTNNNKVIGNLIGTDAAGTSAVANGVGVRLFNGSGNHIGGAAAGERNVISGNHDGVIIGSDGAAGNFVQGNLIGIAADGTSPLGNSGGSAGNGIVIIGSSGNLIGDSAGTPGASNLIAYNSSRGVYVISGSGNRVRANSIFSNGGLGIDLNPAGPTPNDNGDGDSGSNNLQNFPVLNLAYYDGYDRSNTEVTGTLNSTANTSFTLEFFLSPTCDPAGYGEGQTLIGNGVVTTNEGGNASFTFNFATVDLSGQSLSATATDPSGNTSEFSACRLVAPAPRSIQISSPVVNVVEGNTTIATVTVTRTGSVGGAVSVHYATANGATNPATGGLACGANGIDYVNTSGTLAWAANDLSNKTISVPICNDTLAESNETISLILSNPTGGANLGTPETATLTILDNDDPGAINFETAAYSVREGTSVATISVVRTAVDGDPVSVQYATGSGGTATGGASCASGVDYVNASGTLSWAAGDVSPKTITVTICNDTVLEPDETLPLSLNNPTGGATLGSPATAVLTIVNDDHEVIVANTNDNGAGSLRQAIMAANLNQPPDTTKIQFTPGIAGTINLVTALPALGANIFIEGPGANVLTVRRSTAGGTPEFRIFHVNSERTVSISGLTIANGKADGGGGIFNEGTVDVNSCSIEGNTTTFAGGGIDNAGRMNLTNSTISGNTNLFAGAIGGGGIYNEGELHIIGCTISGNSSDPFQGRGHGGGIFNEGLGPLSIAYSTVTANTATYPGVEGAFQPGGGGIYQRPFPDYTPTIKDSLVAANNCPNAPDVSGALNSRDYNLIGSTVGTTITGEITHNITNVDARLGPLTNNGGPTRTHALLSDSPAIDRGDNQEAPILDQRGLPRVSDGNNDGSEIVDIGAFEVQASCSMIFITEALPSSVTGTNYRQTLEISGGTAPYTFSLISGELPRGLALSSDGTLFGIPAEPGNFLFEVYVSDGNSCSRRRSYTLVITCPTITVLPESLPAGTAGTPYQATTFAAEGGASPYTFTLQGSLPSGLNVSGATLSGTPSQDGQFPITVTATDLDGCTASRGYTLVIASAPICALDVTSQLVITRGGLSQNLVTRRFRQTVTIRNDGASIVGPVVYALAGLTAGVEVQNPAGTTSCAFPAGSPYVNLSTGNDNQLATGETITIVLEYAIPSPQRSLTYTPHVLAGPVR
jgi:Calx-beta domain/Putative Ig domain